MDIQQLLVRRKLTTAVADKIRADMVAHLTTLAPLLRPSAVFGDFVHGGSKGFLRGAEKAFKDLKALYDAIAPKPPFGLALELKPPLDVDGPAIDMAPVEYLHKNIRITSPLRWMLAYSGHGVGRLREQLADPGRVASEVQQTVLQILVLHVVVNAQPGVTRLLNEVHLPIRTETLPGLGELPITLIGSVLPTLRPDDEVIVASSGVAGVDAFQEWVDIDAVVGLGNPFRESLLGIVRAHAPELVPG